MKNFLMFSIFTSLAILVPPITVCSLGAQPARAVQDQCSAEAKQALYASFLQNRQSDQKRAYDDAKKFLACPSANPLKLSRRLSTI